MAMNNYLVKFSCVILSAANPNNLNKSINIKNPYGVEEVGIAFTEIKLTLMACTATPIVFIILDIQSNDEAMFAKVVLDKHQLKSMTIDEIMDYLKTQSAKSLNIKTFN